MFIPDDIIGLIFEYTDFKTIRNLRDFELAEDEYVTRLSNVNLMGNSLLIKDELYTIADDLYKNASLGYKEIIDTQSGYLFKLKSGTIINENGNIIFDKDEHVDFYLIEYSSTLKISNNVGIFTHNSEIKTLYFPFIVKNVAMVTFKEPRITAIDDKGKVWQWHNDKFTQIKIKNPIEIKQINIYFFILTSNGDLYESLSDDRFRNFYNRITFIGRDMQSGRPSELLLTENGNLIRQLTVIKRSSPISFFFKRKQKEAIQISYYGTKYLVLCSDGCLYSTPADNPYELSFIADLGDYM